MDRTLPDIVITANDHDRLSRLLAPLIDTNPVAAQLQDELDRAQIVESSEIPADVVTMNSQVVIEEVDTLEQRTVTLAYPASANLEQGRLSILAPVGAALLGLRAGQTIDWPLPNGRVKRVRVVSVTWQPEAAGETNL